MSSEAIAALVLAALAILGAIGSVAMLGFRVGRLVGLVEGHIAGSDGDRARLWTALGEHSSWMQRHLEIYHGSHRVGH